jgi:hypothetical protein
MSAICERSGFRPIELAWRGFLSLRDPAATNLPVGARARGRATRIVTSGPRQRVCRAVPLDNLGEAHIISPSCSRGDAHAACQVT